MYIVEWWSLYERTTCKAAVGSPRELFALIVSLGQSTDVSAWRIQSGKPSDFGWSDDWVKYKNVWDKSVFN